LRGLQQHPAVVALGEMGLDYFHRDVPRDLQRELFEAQLAIASETGKPVVIHCREAVDDTLAVMAAFANVPAVFHCFTGTMEEARRIAARGYLIGFTGPVTFKKNDELRAIAATLPLEQIVVETDAPYLSPEPMRKQKTNEPALVVHTAAAIAKARGMSEDALAEATTANALRFFRWA
jgi:TatD DNase family protein